MELKWGQQSAFWVAEVGFNRTFMELKLLIDVGFEICSFSFNRTFMELKLRSGAERTEVLPTF